MSTEGFKYHGKVVTMLDSAHITAIYFDRGVSVFSFAISGSKIKVVWADASGVLIELEKSNSHVPALHSEMLDMQIEFEANRNNPKLWPDSLSGYSMTKRSDIPKLLNKHKTTEHFFRMFPVYQVIGSLDHELVLKRTLPGIVDLWNEIASKYHQPVITSDWKVADRDTVRYDEMQDVIKFGNILQPKAQSKYDVSDVDLVNPSQEMISDTYDISMKLGDLLQQLWRKYKAGNTDVGQILSVLKKSYLSWQSGKTKIVDYEKLLDDVLIRNYKQGKLVTSESAKSIINIAPKERLKKTGFMR